MLRTHLIAALAVAGLFVVVGAAGGCNSGGGASGSSAAKAAAAVAAVNASTGGSQTPSTPPDVTVKSRNVKVWKTRNGYYVQKNGKTTFVPRR